MTKSNSSPTGVAVFIDAALIDRITIEYRNATKEAS